MILDLGPLGLYEDIDDTRPRARDSYTSYATENTDYLTAISAISAILQISDKNLPDALYKLEK